MEINTTLSQKKIAHNYECDKCNYKCYTKGDYNKHILTHGIFKRTGCIG